ncbi:regulator of G-protein signaling 22-like isoform X1 [Acropora muricata]|uniref:regulator of G-protein signaling 22-like isoform X1 n=2 Tax=Acropora muricata TaxID=159855 RepID=UPI0034E380CC
MKGLQITDEALEDRLAFDEIFVDYFNAFLELPAFCKHLQYDQLTGSFKVFNGPPMELDFHQLLPSQDAEAESKERERVTAWVKRERLPLFLKTRLYLEYKLCRLLLRTLDNRAACASSRGLRGYSRATSYSVLSPIGNVVRPSSHSSNHSWPARLVRHFGRRPLGSATSLPAMLNLGMGQKAVEGPRTNEQPHEEGATALSADKADDKDKQNHPGAAFTEKLKSRAKSVTLLDGAGHGNSEEENESWEARPEIEDETEADDSDVPDHELGAVMEFDEDLLDEAQTEADARNIAKKHQMSFEALKRDVLGSLQGMELFKAFLDDTSGKHLFQFWLDAERYKDSLESEPEETLREQMTKLFREIQDKYKNFLTADAKEQIEKVRYHQGLTQDLFARTQYDMLRRLRSYWIPRFLVHVERNGNFRDQYLGGSELSRPASGLSFFPTLSFAHSLPPLGEWCREVVRSRQWDREIMVKENRNKSARMRLGRIAEEAEDAFTSALRGEKEAGCPFKRYLENSCTDDKSLLFSLLFWLDVTDFNTAAKRSGDHYLRLVNAWAIFNKFIANDCEMSIVLPQSERIRLERILHSANDLPVAFFKPAQEHVAKKLEPSWEAFKRCEEETFVKSQKDSSDRASMVMSVKGEEGSYFSPSSGRWVKRHPGSTPSQRQRRLYTSLAMAEEIDASRLSPRTDSPTRPIIPQPAKVNKAKSKGKKKPNKSTKNVSFNNKKSKAVADSDGDLSDSEKKKTEPEKPVISDFVDVIENKGTVSSFKQYVQNTEGRQALNQLLMYLEIEQYNAILPAKKAQKAQQATLIYKTYFDATSRRSVGLPQSLINQVENERPNTPVFVEAQQFVLSDVRAYFKTFYKNAQDASRRQEGTPNTPTSFNKADTMDSSQSFLQFYRRRTRKAKSTGRLAPTKEDRDNFKKVLQSIHGRLSIKMEYFRRYLQTHGEPDGFPRLENDLVFYLEVQKFKELFSYMDDVSLNRKVEAIIECFLDSATPPWLQIDIGPELASRIIHKSQVFSTGKKVPREQKEPTLFDEAQSILFKELLPYWAGFSKQYTQPEDESKVKLPPTRQEKLLQKRYTEFLKYPAVTKTIVLPLAIPTAHGQSKSELSFSVSDGMKWKETKDLETASIVSSTVDSSRGKLVLEQNGPSLNLSNQQTQVEVKT